MHEESTPKLLITPDDAAVRLSTTADVLVYLAKIGRLDAIYIGQRCRFKPSVIDAACARRDALIGDLTTERLQNQTFMTFEHPALFPQEVARFFGVEESEVRAILGITRRTIIGKVDLWRLVVAGAEVKSKSLSVIEQRLIKTRRKPPIVSATKRAHVIGRDRGRCRYCGRLAARTGIEVDHVVPRRQAGTNDLSNLVVACPPCNTWKGHHLPHEVGLRLLPIGHAAVKKRPSQKRPIDPPREGYATLVMGPDIISDTNNCED